MYIPGLFKPFLKMTLNKTFTSLLLLLLISVSAIAKKSETIIIKTNIYCDHCKECSSCSGKIEHDLSFDKGIEIVKLDEKAMTITVTYNPKKTTPEEIRKLISGYGYDADDVKADPVAVSKLDGCCRKN